MDKQLIIGDILINNNLVMAPMAGITDVPFRELAKDGGAGLVCTEMISSKALVYNDKRTRRMLELSKSEHPVSVQIFGSDPESISQAAKIAEDNGADIIDINLGCPVPKIMKAGAGVKLVENEQLLIKIMESAAKSVKVPVTIKIRTGLNKEENIAPRIVQCAAQAGIKAVTIHGRAAESRHSGDPDLEAIRQAVNEAKIPVIGNGGITDELSAEKFIKASGCQGLMIGRAAIGDYDIFKRIAHYLNTGNTLPSPSWEDRIASLKRHANMAAEYYGEKTGLMLLRKIAAFYIKGLPNASRLRGNFVRLESLKELDNLLEDVWQSPYFGDTNETLLR